MSPTQTTLPAFQRVLEAHATWQHWTAALRVYWTPDGVTVRDVPAAWGPDITAPALHSEGRAMPAPRIRLWRLVSLALGRQFRVEMVSTGDPTVLQLRIKET